MNIKVDYKKTGISKDEIKALEPMVLAAHDMLHSGSGAGSDFLGWVDLPVNYDKNEFEAVKRAAKKIRDMADVLVVIGIGGSYLGAKAVIDALSDNFYNLKAGASKNPVILYAGNNISGTYLSQLLDYLKDKDVCLNVISKSGTTTEPAIAFRVLKKLVEEKYGKDGAKERIFATTDKARGALKQLATEEGYETFVIPDNVGGRYSVLTPVGLLPIAVAGISIDEMMAGAAEAREEYANKDVMNNDCYKYAILRNILYNKGKSVELMVDYEPQMFFVSEWWKQLFGESEGKANKGLFPASVHFSTDLHSMGQYIQEGRRDLFETVLHIENFSKDVDIEKNEKNLDGLNYLAGKSFNYVNESAFKGTLLAHHDGGVPNIVIDIESLNSRSLAKLLYFFEKACGISAYMLGVNPFDQPGVEAYKKNVFAILDKPGYEDLRKEILKGI